ncbi:DNA-directed RNA polymerase [Diatrype stigma]|uniref:DNA-directed RNA polymerase n=1 Tax=Diatrype stigma TaxID=117547 RepID=A0AAN9YRS6_9PEZI
MFRGLSLSRVGPSLRPRLAPRPLAVHPLPSEPSRRQFLTRPNLLPWRRKTPNNNPYGAITQRPLATAMESADDPIRQENVSFDQLQSRIPNRYSYPPGHVPLYNLRSVNSHSPLVIKPNYEPNTRGRANSSGLPGGVEDMLSVFDACLQVNKFDRAALVLERLGGMPDIMPDFELVAHHNRYLRARLDRAYEQSSASWADSLQKWFEVQIRGKELPHTPETIACMLKVTLLSAQGERLQQLVDRYMDMVPGEAMYEVFAQDGILTQQDLGTITSIYKPASSMDFDDWEMPLEDTDLEADSSVTVDSTDGSFDFPEVLGVDQKGLGLKTLRGVLSFFEDIEGKDLSQLTYDERREIQARLEKDCVEAAVNRWKEENETLQKMGRNTSLTNNALNSQLYNWHIDLEKKIKGEFELFEISENTTHKTEDDMGRCVYGPFMRQSDPTRLAAVTILSVLNTVAQQGADRGVSLTILLNNLAKAVEDDIRQLIWERAHPPYKKGARRPKPAAEPTEAQQDAAAAAPDVPGSGAAPAEAAPAEAAPAEAAPAEAAPAASEVSEIEATKLTPKTEDAPRPNVIECSVYDVKHWPPYIKTKVGAALLEMLLDTAKVNVVREHPETKQLINQLQPAMAHTSVYRKGKKVGVVIPNKWLVDLLKREPRGDFLARHLPMLVEPEPWTKFDRGGFLSSPSQLVRIKNGEKDQRIYAQAAVERGDMEQVSKGLDVLGRTAWQINRPVLKVMLEAWNSGEQVANIPPLHPNIPIPPEPAPTDDMMHRRDWLRAVKAVENRKSGLHSDRCFINFQLEIARTFKDQVFYFPHNMDFRGRAYPIPTYLNHMGADHTRGLLRFANGRELGKSGLRWLKVHLANVFGFDKASLEEREQFAMENIANLTESANNPLHGEKWWLKAADPWQCLAASFELKAALESPDPEKYVSHLPVHMDGTCNGLQHYAALGGDRWGAQQVNLVPGKRPADVYSAVAELVKENVAEDLKLPDNLLARAIDGKITRKVVKQTVMTNVYGVTFIGAKAQVLKQLEAAYPDMLQETGVAPALAASYVATKIFKALSTMFRGAHDIQYWLGECAGRVCRALTPEQLDQIAEGPSKKKTNARSTTKVTPESEILNSFRSTIVWTTPLRMPVVQPYRKSCARIIRTSLQDMTLQMPQRSDPVNRRKQLQAFPPNFIHSLDASHMLLSALECDELGLSFAAVHDSFWTHAADVDVMNRVLRDAFIRIHREDVIGRLASEFEARYQGSIYLTTIEPGTTLDQEVRALRKSHKVKPTLRDELLQERERQKLLRSDDPEKVAKGRAMVTPASLFELHTKEKENATDQITPVNSEMNAVALGHIPGGDHSDDIALAESADDAEDDMADMDDQQDAEPALDEDENVKPSSGATEFERNLAGTAKKHSVAHPRYNKIWLPLTFPAIPPKVRSLVLTNEYGESETNNGLTHYRAIST